jgi:replication factor C large subunit
MQDLLYFFMGDWTEDYRPKSLDEIVGNERAIIELTKWASSWSKGIPKKRAVILSGKPGTGKTSSALALANDFGWIPIELNTSDARNALKIKNVATSGAINETFSDDGTFISSQKGGRKLIILDEADNLYEKVSSINNDISDLSDKGGKKAIIDTIKSTCQPIILIVNDFYALTKGGGEALKSMCLHIKFYVPFSSSIFTLLRKICLKEGINVDQNVLKTLSDRSKGDIRSAVNDLQSISLDKTIVDIKSISVLGYRDRDKDIFNGLRDVFKTRNIKSIRESLAHLDLDPKLVILWICENLPREYLDSNDLANGYEALSKADLFLGRTSRKQNYALWSYACDLMNGGVATAKTHNYPNDSYNFPTWLRERKEFRNKFDVRNLILEKLNSVSHCSKSKNISFLLSYFIHMFRNNTYFAIKMKNKLELSENEIKYLLGESHKHKLKEIMISSKIIFEKPLSTEPTKEVEEEKTESMQQSLFDF